MSFVLSHDLIIININQALSIKCVAAFGYRLRSELASHLTKLKTLLSGQDDVNIIIPANTPIPNPLYCICFKNKNRLIASKGEQIN